MLLHAFNAHLFGSRDTTSEPEIFMNIYDRLNRYNSLYGIWEFSVENKIYLYVNLYMPIHHKDITGTAPSKWVDDLGKPFAKLEPIVDSIYIYFNEKIGQWVHSNSHCLGISLKLWQQEDKAWWDTICIPPRISSKYACIMQTPSLEHMCNVNKSICLM